MSRPKIHDPPSPSSVDPVFAKPIVINVIHIRRVLLINLTDLTYKRENLAYSSTHLISHKGKTITIPPLVLAETD